LTDTAVIDLEICMALLHQAQQLRLEHCLGPSATRRVKAIASVAFAIAADRVISLPFCAVGGWTAFGEGRHRRGAAWPDR
jgi:hypothetical protein